MSDVHLRHGIFLPPFHPNEEDPTQCLERDLELMEWLDRLGFDEAWIGEHHSAGFETITSPELFIAAPPSGRGSIRLGTGVISLPYHNPLMVAEPHHPARSHDAGPGHVRRRAGAAGVRRADAGHRSETQRDRMAESLDVDPAPVQGRDRHREDRLVHAGRRRAASAAVHQAVSRGGGRQRGDALGRAARGQIRPRHAVRRRDRARRFRRARDRTGRSPTRSRPSRAARWTRTGCAWSARCTSPRRASRRTRTRSAGLRAAIIGYLNNNQPRFYRPRPADPVEWFVDNQLRRDRHARRRDRADRAAAGQAGRVRRVPAQAHNWADWEATKRSYELYARYVMPHFSKANAARQASYEWCGDNRAEFGAKRNAAAKAMFDKHEAEQRATRESAETSRPVRGREAW